MWIVVEDSAHIGDKKWMKWWSTMMRIAANG